MRSRRVVIAGANVIWQLGHLPPVDCKLDAAARIAINGRGGSGQLDFSVPIWGLKFRMSPDEPVAGVAAVAFVAICRYHPP